MKRKDLSQRHGGTAVKKAQLRASACSVRDPPKCADLRSVVWGLRTLVLGLRPVVCGLRAAVRKEKTSHRGTETAVKKAQLRASARSVRDPPKCVEDKMYF